MVPLAPAGAVTCLAVGAEAGSSSSFSFREEVDENVYDVCARLLRERRLGQSHGDERRDDPILRDRITPPR